MLSNFSGISSVPLVCAQQLRRKNLMKNFWNGTWSISDTRHNTFCVKVWKKRKFRIIHKECHTVEYFVSGLSDRKKGESKPHDDEGLWSVSSVSNGHICNRIENVKIDWRNLRAIPPTAPRNKVSTSGVKAFVACCESKKHEIFILTFCVVFLRTWRLNFWEDFSPIFFLSFFFSNVNISLFVNKFFKSKFCLISRINFFRSSFDVKSRANDLWWFLFFPRQTYWFFFSFLCPDKWNRGVRAE